MYWGPVNSPFLEVSAILTELCLRGPNPGFPRQRTHMATNWARRPFRGISSPPVDLVREDLLHVPFTQLQLFIFDVGSEEGSLRPHQSVGIFSAPLSPSARPYFADKWPCLHLWARSGRLERGTGLGERRAQAKPSPVLPSTETLLFQPCAHAQQATPAQVSDSL